MVPVILANVTFVTRRRTTFVMELGEFVIPKRYYFVTYTSLRDLVLRPGETKTV